MKNEHDALIEWIAYHRVIGVRHFILADNMSNDGSQVLLKKLSALNIITWFTQVDIPDQRPQLPAYRQILRRCPPQADVVAFIDADEFIVPMDGSNSLAPALQRWFKDESVSAVALNWACFGSSGHKFAEQGLVTERFQRRAVQSFTANHHYKSIVRPERVDSFDNPHHAKLRWGRYIDVRGQDLVLHEKHGKGLSEQTCWEQARINHYAVKSFEEFLLGKHLRGSAAKEGRIKHRRYFEHHDKNDEVCTLAADLTSRVKAEIIHLEQLLADLPNELIAEPNWRHRIRSWIFHR